MILFIKKLLLKIVAYISCLWLIIWMIPHIISGFMIDILFNFFNIEKDIRTIKAFGLLLKAAGNDLKNRNHKNLNNQENEVTNE